MEDELDTWRKKLVSAAYQWELCHYHLAVLIWVVAAVGAAVVGAAVAVAISRWMPL